MSCLTLINFNNVGSHFTPWNIAIILQQYSKYCQYYQGVRIDRPCYFTEKKEDSEPKSHWYSCLIIQCPYKVQIQRPSSQQYNQTYKSNKLLFSAFVAVLYAKTLQSAKRVVALSIRKCPSWDKKRAAKCPPDNVALKNWAAFTVWQKQRFFNVDELMQRTKASKFARNYFRTIHFATDYT